MNKKQLVAKISSTLNLSKADPGDLEHWEELESIIKASGKEVRENIAGKFIFVGVN